MLKVVKKDGNLERWDAEKIKTAITKSAVRAVYPLTEDDKDRVVSKVQQQLDFMNRKEVSVSIIHSLVENALDDVAPIVADSYREYRNFKSKYADMMDRVSNEANRIQFLGDKENSNADSTLVSTKRTLIANSLNKELYKKFQMNRDEIQAVKDGYIYIHDMSARRDTMNCCLFRLGDVMDGGFEMSNLWYNEPKTIDTAFDVTGDIVLMAAAQQYGGFTIPEIDKIMVKYAEKSFERYKKINIERGMTKEDAEKYADIDTKRDIRQGYQGLEYKFNTVASSRGDYPFITITFGLATSYWGKEIAKTILQVHQEGQGKPGYKKPVLFPKLVFLYDKNLHGPGKESEDVFEAGIECSGKTMYPDWLSLTGEGYVPEMYKKYGKVVSPMGCVDGQEIISYHFHNNLFVESFERMWERIVAEYPDKGQSFKDDPNRLIDLRKADVEIFDTLKGFTKVNFVIRNVQDNWCDVTISNGRKLRVTTDHPFETDRGVVFAKDLTTEDIIPINLNQYTQESFHVDADYAWLLGLILCDGCYQNHSVFVSLGIDEDDIKERFIEAFAKYFQITPRAVIHNRGKKGNYQDVRAYSDGIHSLSEIIDTLTKEFGGVQKIYRHIPEYVFMWNKEARLAFLAGMIDADGYVNADTNKHKYPTVQMGSINKELSLQQMALAQSLGMEAKLYTNHYSSEDKTKIRYRIEFFPTKSLIDAMCSQKKKDKWEYFEDEYENISYEHITHVEFLESKEKRFSYDVSTESEHFEVSGVYSHNCRAFLSPWYERGGMTPADEDDVPVFEGRWNVGAVSLHLPMILAKSREEKKDFYEVLDYYLEMIRQIHLRTYDYLGKLKASGNPLAYCEGGFYKGHLDYDDTIEPLLPYTTASFGITALNELQMLYNGKSLVEDGAFCLEVMKHINEKLDEFKQEDHHLYAVYGTPAENLCGLQIKQFRKKYGIIPGVSDREYVSNSFHCHVTEDISPIMKQDLEGRFWDLFKGGRIQYCRYELGYNIDAVKTLVRRAMDKGFYEGVNLALSYCNQCGHEELDMDVCPVCGSKDLTKIDRMNGYLSYSRVRGESRLNDAKMAEIKERKSM